MRKKRTSSRVSPRNFLAGLSPDDFRVFRELMQPMTFEDGQHLFRQGDLGQGAFFIDEGTIALSVRLPAGGEKALATVYPGELLGELTLIDEARRTASARAVGQVKVLRVDRTDFRGLLAYFNPASLSVTRRLALLVGERIRATVERVLELDGVLVLGTDEPTPEPAPGKDSERGSPFEVRPFLPQLPFFEHFTAADLDHFLELTGPQLWTVPRGREICVPTHSPRASYIVVRGAVERVVGGSRSARRVGVFGPGAIFGELSVLLDCPRTARCRAREDTVMLEIGRETMEALVWGRERISFKFLTAVTRRLTRRLAQLNRLVSHIEQEHFGADQGAFHTAQVSMLGGRAAATQSGHLLVVDDSEMNRAIIKMHLDDMGHTCAEASDGLEALDMLQQDHFDAVLLDIQMPRLDGHQTLARIKGSETLRHVPVIMITAVESLDIAVECLQLGAEDYLPRSFDENLLKARIDVVLERERYGARRT